MPPEQSSDRPLPATPVEARACSSRSQSSAAEIQPQALELQSPETPALYAALDSDEELASTIAYRGNAGSGQWYVELSSANIEAAYVFDGTNIHKNN